MENKNSFVISEVIWSSWEKFKTHWKSLLVVAFGYIIATLPFSILDAIWNTRLYELQPVFNEFLGEEVMESVWVAGTSESILYAVFTLLSVAWSLIVGYNMFKAYFSVYDHNKYNFASMFNIPQRDEMWKFLRYLGTLFIYGLGVVLGLILLIIPGIYIAIRYGFAMYLAVDKNLSVRENFEMSSKMTENIKWKLLGFGVVQGLLMLGVILVGLLCLIVGVIPAVFVAMSWMMLMDIFLFRKLYQAHK